jgi:hypothetical protein
MMRRSFVTCLGVLCVLLSTAAGAGDGGPAAPGAKLLTPSERRALRSVETIYVWKMTDAVGMTEEQAAQIFPRVREAFQARWPLAAQRRHLLVLLRRAVDEPSGSDNLSLLLAQWEDNEMKLRASRQRMSEALTRVLSVEQQVRCLLFEEQFHGDLARMVEEYRRSPARSAVPALPERR